MIVKLVNAGDSAAAVRVESSAPFTGKSRATVIAAAPMAENSLANPDVVKPLEEDAEVTGGVVERTLPPYSLTVLRIPR